MTATRRCRDPPSPQLSLLMHGTGVERLNAAPSCPAGCRSLVLRPSPAGLRCQPRLGPRGVGLGPEAGEAGGRAWWYR